MLPKLSQSTLSKKNTNFPQQNSLSVVDQSTISEQRWEKGVKQIKICEDKLDEQLFLNKKLKNLYTALKQNLDRNSTANDEEEQLSTLLKERKKYETEYQHQCHLLNALISDNSKLKDQVNTERSKRAIYFNIYKNLQHQIQIWERKYKNQLVETLKAQGVMSKLKEKFHKSQKKMNKEIINLSKEIEKCGRDEGTSERTEDDEKQYSRVSKHKKTFQQFMFLEKKQQKIEVVVDEKETSMIKSQICEEEQEYLLEQRKLNANGALQRIKSILCLEDLEEIKQFWSNIDTKTESLYEQILQEQKKDKKLAEDIESMRMKINGLNQANIDRKLTIKQEKDKQQKIQQKRQEVKELEGQIGETIGMKVCELENDMLLHHCLRVREEKTERKEGKRNLQKFLQQSKKNKIECSVLLSPKQMHRRLVESQAFGNEAGMYHN